MSVKRNIIDANEAVARVAYKLNEVVAIYPITPASQMGEWADIWAAAGVPNVWGDVPHIVELQSEGGAAGAVHGSLQNGALTTTFTASQGLLLMIPNMFKLAGELTPLVIHVAARTIATHALSIFCDHSDVMAVRSTGFGILCSNSVQEAADMAVISHALTLQAQLPILHFFDGFRTSHELSDIEEPTNEVLKAMISADRIRQFRMSALRPESPVMRGSAQNPDVFFQAREACNPYYDAFASTAQTVMDEYAALTGRQYHLYDYFGADDAERVLIMMGSGVEAARETADAMNATGEKVGVLSVRMFRPFDGVALLNVLPATVKSIAVLDRTKEPGAHGEPLYKDVMTAIIENRDTDLMPVFGIPKIVGGRYGLSSKEFTPGMIKRIYEELATDKPMNNFTVGINDDVTHRSLEVTDPFDIEPDHVFRGMFYGLGADGTVGANKNSIKIIGDYTGYHAQGYFVYDSKKSGSMTVSHLRFSPEPIRSTYLIRKANFIACHQPSFIGKVDFLASAAQGSVLLLNHPEPADQVWAHLPADVQQRIRELGMTVYTIDAEKVARDTGMGNRINTVMQTCFFAISGVLPRDKAIDAIKDSIKKTYGKRGPLVVQKNDRAVDQSIENMYKVDIPAEDSSIDISTAFNFIEGAPEFVQRVTKIIMEGKGDSLPVSAMPVDGTFPTDTAQWEKRCIASEIPVWDPDICIQCGKCAMVCPHSVIRIKAYDGVVLESAPDTLLHTSARGKEWPEDTRYTIQVAPDDCTGCSLCYEVCPAKDKTNLGRKALMMEPIRPHLSTERVNWDYFLSIPETDRSLVKHDTVKGSQFLQPLFEFSGACSGCGETPYIKLATQLFGDRMVVANATGCSSIYGGNLPTTPWSKNKVGYGPAWSNSLFEDNAEFGLGYRVSIDQQTMIAQSLLRKLSGQLGDELVSKIIDNPQEDEADIYTQRETVAILKDRLNSINTDDAKRLTDLADTLVRRSVWLIGGDGWAYDIGYGGLDHVMASGRDVNILVLDTEVYSNTGGQCSKATPLGAIAKFAMAGKRRPKKDLAAQALTYGNVYVARIAMGADDTQTVKALIEAERYRGPSLIIAYSHCIAHGYDMKFGLDQQAKAVKSGYWPLYRYDPEKVLVNKNPLTIDSKAPSLSFSEYALSEMRYQLLTKTNPAASRELLKAASDDIQRNWKWLQDMRNHYEPASTASTTTHS